MAASYKIGENAIQLGQMKKNWVKEPNMQSN